MAPALQDAPPHELVVDGETLAVRVRVSSQAGTIRVRVGPDRPVEIIVPFGTSAARIDKVLDERRDWIAGKLKRVRSIGEREPRLGLDRPGVVWVNLQALAVERCPAASDGARLHGSALVVGGEEARVPGAVERWYRREARRALLAVVGREAERLAVSYQSVTVRDQRTRWGSCSAAGNLSFNWRLLMAPAEVRRYVVVHELCHLREANHSKDFWRVVDSAYPGWHASAAWLREHGAELRAYQPVTALVPSR